MAEGIIRVIRAVPNAPTLVPILRLFEKKGEGMVTCLPDGMLASLRDALGTSSLLDFIEWPTLVHQVALLSGEEIKGLAANTLVEAAVSFSFYDLESDSPYANSKTHVGAHRSVRVKTSTGFL